MKNTNIVLIPGTFVELFFQKLKNLTARREGNSKLAKVRIELNHITHLYWRFFLVKQIAGRAGRYGSIYDSGVVTAMDKPSLKYIRSKLQTETTPILVRLQLLSYYITLLMAFVACWNFSTVWSNRYVRPVFTEQA